MHKEFKETTMLMTHTLNTHTTHNTYPTHTEWDATKNICSIKAINTHTMNGSKQSKNMRKKQINGQKENAKNGRSYDVPTSFHMQILEMNGLHV